MMDTKNDYNVEVLHATILFRNRYTLVIIIHKLHNLQYLSLKMPITAVIGFWIVNYVNIYIYTHKIIIKRFEVNFLRLHLVHVRVYT